MGQDRDGFKETSSLASPLAAVTISCGLGERRTMQMALNLSCADPIELQNEMIDRAMHLLDRQQARYDLEKEEENFTACGINTRNLLAGLPVADNVEKMKVAKLKVELQAKLDARKEVYEAGYNDHVGNHRRGEFDPKGSLKQRLAAMDMDIQKVKDAVEAAPKDAEQEREKLVNTIKRHQEDLRIRRKAINDLRTLAGLSLNTEFEDAENAKV